MNLSNTSLYDWDDETDVLNSVDDSLSTFRLAAKKILLTYHNYTDDLSDLLLFLQERLCKHHISDYAIAFHTNPTGIGTHVHCYIELIKKLDTRNSEFFNYYNYKTKQVSRGSIRRIKDRYRNFGSLIHRNAGLATDPIEYVLKEIELTSNIGVDYLVSENIYKRLGTRGNLLSPSAAAIRSAKNQNVSEALDILHNDNADSHSFNYTCIKKNLIEVATDNKKESYDTLGLLLNEYMYTKIDKLISIVESNKSGTLVMVGKALISKAGLFLQYLRNTYPNIGPAFRITSFTDLDSIPLNCKILILDNICLKDPIVLAKVKPLLRVVSKTTINCSSYPNYVEPPVGTILFAPNKTALRPLLSTLRVLEIEPTFVSKEHFEIDRTSLYT
jgi:hypothetical protein